MKNTTTKNRFESRAIQEAERRGVIEYKVKGSYMIYYANYREFASVRSDKPGYKADTYKVTIDLITGQEKRELMKNYNKRGEYNRGC